MGRKNNQLKMLANIAKQRLINGGYSENEERSVFVPKVSNYFIKNANAMKKMSAQIEYVKIGDKINSDFKQKVECVLKNEKYELNPFNSLIDYDVYNNMSTVEKESYMLKIAEYYNLIKEMYEKEKEAI